MDLLTAEIQSRPAYGEKVGQKWIQVDFILADTVADSNSVERFNYAGTTYGGKLYQEHRRTMFRCVLVEGHPDLVNDVSLVLVLLLCSRSYPLRAGPSPRSRRNRCICNKRICHESRNIAIPHYPVKIPV
ncbi:hypothetical protein PG984_016232 [Apiospora sp. TS-2023a]